MQESEICWGCTSVVGHCLACMRETLGSVPSTLKRKGHVWRKSKAVLFILSWSVCARVCRCVWLVSRSQRRMSGGLLCHSSWRKRLSLNLDLVWKSASPRQPLGSVPHKTELAGMGRASLQLLYTVARIWTQIPSAQQMLLPGEPSPCPWTALSLNPPIFTVARHVAWVKGHTPSSRPLSLVLNKQG